jgi:hypothetical protein
MHLQEDVFEVERLDFDFGMQSRGERVRFLRAPAADADRGSVTVDLLAKGVRYADPRG